MFRKMVMNTMRILVLGASFARAAIACKWS